MNTRTVTPTLAWMSDLHLDAATQERRQRFFQQMRESLAEAFLITGDISKADMLSRHLRELAKAAEGRIIYFTLGNHDFYGSSIREVEKTVTGLCLTENNLRHLDGTQAISLDSETALIGHRGWADGRMGWAEKSFARNPDFKAIEDFRTLNRETAFRLLEKLGTESSSQLRRTLPYALTCYKRVILATHVPPFPEAARFRGRPCDWLRQPFFCNIALGAMLLRLSQNFPHREILVLSGHAHSASSVRVAKNVHVLTAHARTGFPEVGRIFSVRNCRTVQAKQTAATTRRS